MGETEVSKSERLTKLFLETSRPFATMADVGSISQIFAGAKDIQPTLQVRESAGRSRVAVGRPLHPSRPSPPPPPPAPPRAQIVSKSSLISSADSAPSKARCVCARRPGGAAERAAHPPARPRARSAA